MTRHLLVRRRRLLSVHLGYRVLGFAIGEVDFGLVDWGMRRLYSSNTEEMLSRVEQLIDHFRPEGLVFQSLDGSRRGPQIKRAMDELKTYVASRLLETIRLSRAEVRARLDLPTDASNCEVAEAVARLVPELAEHLPPRRKRWEGESRRMALFSAAAWIVAVLSNC